MSNFQHEQIDNFDITGEELDRIKEALKKKEFRDLLKAYIEEINDPDNRNLYEKEITQLEKERGFDINFIHPKFEYLIKTSCNGVTKTYINICSNENVSPPSPDKMKEKSNEGSSWSIPFLLTPLKVNYGKNKNTFHVYDAIFHPDAAQLANKSNEFFDAINKTAIEGIESNFNVTLDSKNIKILRTKYKGGDQPTVIRKKLPGVNESNNEDFKIFQSKVIENIKQKINNDDAEEDCKDSDYAVPKFVLKYRSCVDLQDFTNDSVSHISALPLKEIVVVIHLPLIKAASDADLNITRQKLVLICDSSTKYKLELSLPHPVFENQGNAVFDKSKRELTVTLPILKVDKDVENKSSSLGDSGIESDVAWSSSSVEDEIVLSCNGKTSLSKDDKSSSDNELFECEGSFNESAVLNDKVHYLLPKFTNTFLNDTLTFTLHVKNIDPASVSFKRSKNTAFRFYLTSIGSGHFPAFYSFFVDLTVKIDTDLVKIDVSDSNVIIKFTSESQVWQKIPSCFVGLKEDDTNAIEINLAHLNPSDENLEEEKDNNGISKKAIKNSIANNKSKNGKTELDKKEKAVPSVQSEKNVRANRKTSNQKKERCYSSSCPDSDVEKSDLRASFDDSFIEGRRERKGILKYSRSLSESDTNGFNLYSKNYSRSLHDCTQIGSQDDDHKMFDKKVRFNDVISSKTFRSNVSILSQKKRTQKKQKYKKRMQERKASESETECETESKLSDAKPSNNHKNKESKFNGCVHNSNKIEDNENHDDDVNEAETFSETSADNSDASENNDNQAPSETSVRKCKARRFKNWRKTTGANSKLKILNDLMFELDDV